MIPPVSFIVDGRQVDVSNWTCNAVLNRGFDNFRGTVKAQDALRMGQMSKLTAYVDANQVLWEGRLALDPYVSDGLAQITASGNRAMVEKAAGRLNYQSRDTSLFVDESTPPHNYTTSNPAVGMSIGAGIISFTLGSGVTIAVGDSHGCVVWTPKSRISRYALDYRTTGSGTWGLQCNTGTAPDGALSILATDSLSGGTGSIDRVVTTDTEMIVLRAVVPPVASPTTSAHTVDLTNIRINGITLGDDFSASDVFLDVGARLGYDTSGVEPNALNVLPLDHREPWVNLLDYMTVLTDWHWEVYEDRGAGPRMVFKDFEDEWTITKAQDARLNLPSLEQFNKVVVQYPTATGVPAEVTDWPDTDPLGGRGVNAWTESLSDNQADETLATNVAATLAEKYAAVRYQGSIEIANAIDPSGKSNVLGIRPGVLANITDYGPMQDLPLRVHEVEYRHDGVTLGIESPVSAAGLIARRLLERARS